MNANITVLKDENLGGVEREYREVVREARVGELVKSSVDTPPIFTVRNTGYGPGIVYGGADGLATFPKNYVVLEPSEVIRIESVRFRMVDRKAAVGERVIVTGESCACYQTGEFAKVLSSNGRVAFVDLTENADYYDDGKWYIDRIDYRVLEPVETEPLSAKPAPDQAAEIIAALTTRVSALEKRVAALDPAPINPRFSDLGVRAQEAADAFAKATQRTSATVAEVTANLAQRAEEARQRKRDDIVERAKEDVEKLIADACGDNLGAWEDIPALKYRGHVTFKFAVNRQKRKVTALAFLRYSPNGVSPRFKASAFCAPDDVFNVWIGKAIALRRALGLEIPEEYVSAPQPTEIRVGDVVEGTSHSGAIGPVLELGHDGEENFVIYRNDTNLRYVNKCWSGVARVIILDDSREEDSAEPRKEVA